MASFKYTPRVWILFSILILFNIDGEILNMFIIFLLFFSEFISIKIYSYFFSNFFIILKLIIFLYEIISIFLFIFTIKFWIIFILFLLRYFLCVFLYFFIFCFFIIKFFLLFLFFDSINNKSDSFLFNSINNIFLLFFSILFVIPNIIMLFPTCLSPKNIMVLFFI